MSFNRFKRGKGRTVRRVPGTMNKTEQAYAKVLGERITHGIIEHYGFESMTLKLAPDTRWTPDYFVLMPDGEIQFHEVKGRNKKTGKPRIEDHSFVKIKVAAAMFPFRFIVVWPNGLGGWDSKEVEAV